MCTSLRLAHPAVINDGSTKTRRRMREAFGTAPIDSSSDNVHVIDMAFAPNDEEISVEIAPRTSAINIPDNAYVIHNGHSGLDIVSCSKETIEVRGWRARELVNDTILMYTKVGEQDHAMAPCQPCSPLFRRVVAVKSSSLGVRVLKTEFLTFNDLSGGNVDPLLHDVVIESTLDCVHSRSITNARHLASGENVAWQEVELPPYPQACIDYYSLEADGSCKYTDCCLGSGATNGTQCYYCGMECSNGCGSGSIFFNGEFHHFSIAEPCCIHDTCYVTGYARKRCDQEFFHSIVRQCPSTFVIKQQCQVYAFLAFIIVSLLGGPAYASSQEKRKQYEQTAQCLAC